MTISYSYPCLEATVRPAKRRWDAIETRQLSNGTPTNGCNPSGLTSCRSGDNWSSIPIRFVSGFTLVELLVVITVIGILLGLLLPAVQAARESSRRTACSNNLRQLGIGLHSYHGQYGRFPAGALLHEKPTLTGISWHVMILPFIEEGSVYDQIAPNSSGGATNPNLKFHSIDLYNCPSAPPLPESSQVLKTSNYTGVSGPGRNGDVLVFGPGSLWGDVCTDGLLYPGSRTKAAHVNDGTSHTLAIGERTYTLSDWMRGAEWEGPAGKPKTEMCASSSKNIRYPINADLEYFGYYKGDFSVPPVQRKIEYNDLFFGSFHPHGAYFCYADGSVRMLADSIHFTLFEDLATIAGDEVEQDAP